MIKPMGICVILFAHLLCLQQLSLFIFEKKKITDAEQHLLDDSIKFAICTYLVNTFFLQANIKGKKLVRILNTNKLFDDKESKKKVNFSDTAEYKAQYWCYS